jgi:hypothetical protein
MGRWFISFLTRNPDDLDGQWEVGIDERLYKLYQNQGREVNLARIVLVDEVLSDPIALIQGWSRPDKEDCFVYVGRPREDYRSFTIQTAAPPGKLFLVFILPSGSIDLWTWRNSSADDPDMPEDVKGTLIWPSQLKT